jgi:hypothetical protein
MRLDPAAYGKYRDMLFQPFLARIHGLLTHTLYLPPDLKFLVVTGGGNFPSQFLSLTFSQPDHFYLMECPEELTVERDFLSALIRSGKDEQDLVCLFDLAAHPLRPAFIGVLDVLINPGFDPVSSELVSQGDARDVRAPGSPDCN